MYQSKNHPLKIKKQLNAHNVSNSTPIKIGHNNDNLAGMVLKNLKPKGSSYSILKSPDKKIELKTSSNSADLMSHHVQSVNTNPEKRKDEKFNNGVRKKIKTDSLQKSDSNKEGVPSKKQNKVKSTFSKTYVCKYCCRRFHSGDQLNDHINNDHGSNPEHICHLCHQPAASFSALMTHYLKHSGNKSDSIDKIFAKSKADFANIQFNLSSKPKPSFECNKCKLTFSNRSKYESHNCSESPKKREYNCAYCSHSATTVEDYRNHLQTHTQTLFTCSYCKHKVASKKELLAHREVCKQRQKVKEGYKCERCNLFKGKTKKELVQHQLSCGNSGENYTCEKCHKQFQEKKIYEDHLSVCKNTKLKSRVKKTVKPRIKNKESVNEKSKLLCCVCNYTCCSKAEHEEHESQCLAEMANRSTEKATDFLSTCNKEDRDKYTDSNKNANENSISPENSSKVDGARRSARLVHRRSSCVDDDDGFSARLGRRRRRRRRSSYIDYEDFGVPLVHRRTSNADDEDNAQLVRRSSGADDDFGAQSVHRRSSGADEEDFGAQFVRRKSSGDEDVKPKTLKIKLNKKSKLLFKAPCRKGRQSKNADNPFKCNYCDFTFCSKSTLLRHKRMHSGNPWYICQFCGKFFFRKDVYIRHEMNVHKNDVKSVFCCYYCKLCFTHSSALKDHVVAEHKKSAFLPVKPDFSEKSTIKSVKMRIKVKEEPDVKKDEAAKTIIHKTKEIHSSPNKKNLLESVQSSFKCSVCFECFENSAAIESHMHTHANLKKETCEITKPHNVQNNYKPTSPNKYDSDVGKVIDQSLEDTSVLTTITSDIADEYLSNSNEELVAVHNKFSGMEESDLCTNTSDSLQPLNCYLCSKKFSSKTLLDAHNKALHRLVDWYQCLVCSSCGPKREMLEHMLTHMYKVGSFVVGESKDYDNIISCFQTDNKQLRNDKISDISKNKQNTCVSGDANLVLYDDLPPLREYGLCPCVDDSCNEKAYDANLAENDTEKSTEDVIGESLNENSIAEKLIENSSAEKLTENSIAEKLTKNNTAEKVKENSITNELTENSTKDKVTENSTKDKVTENSIKDKVAENSIIDKLTESCISDKLTENSIIEKLTDNSITENLVGNSNTENATNMNDSEALDCAQENSTLCGGFNDGKILSSNESITLSVGNQSMDIESISINIIEDNKVSNVEVKNSSEILSPEKENSVTGTKCKEIMEVDNNKLTRSFSQFHNSAVGTKFKGNIEVDSNKSAESFSQLRFLLQSPSKQNSSCSFPLLDSPSFFFDKHNLPVKFTNRESPISEEVYTENKNDLNFELSKQSFGSNDSSRVSSMQDNNQSNTCLKCDVNQSRGVFAENLTTSISNQNCLEACKNENLFKACTSQNPILDFSDLIQHSFEISSPSDDNIFSYITPKQVDPANNRGPREEMNTPDCSHMATYDSTGYNSAVKCERCNMILVNHIEKINHKCSSNTLEQPRSEDIFQYKPKNNSQSFTSVEIQNKTEASPKPKLSPVQGKQIHTFVCSLCTKVFLFEEELLKHQKIEHSPSTNECNKCHRTFAEISELMKHSLTCLKTYFLKTNVVNDCIGSPEFVQSLLRNDDLKTNFSDFSLNSSLAFNTEPTDLSFRTSESSSKRSFNS